MTFEGATRMSEEGRPWRLPLFVGLWSWVCESVQSRNVRPLPRLTLFPLIVYTFRHVVITLVDIFYLAQRGFLYRCYHHYCDLIGDNCCRAVISQRPSSSSRFPSLHLYVVNLPPEGFLRKVLYVR